MSDKRLIYLIRHGEILIEKQVRRYIGQSDILLSQDGICQAQLVQAQLAKQELTAVFCSDLVRSVATAEIIAKPLNLAPTSRRDLREISMGNWEGKTFTEIERLYPTEYVERGKDIVNYVIPGGESFATCQTRILAAFTELVSTTTGNILIVGHAGVNRILLCHILGMPLENLFHIAQDYSCINIIAAEKNQYHIKLLNGLANPGV
ncbi:MAG: pspB [Firmicutes bacterium]|nr:pspB [Bacillota bacterium]